MHGPRGLDVGGGEERLQAVRAEHLRAGVHAHDEKTLRGVVVEARRAVRAAVLGDDPRRDGRHPEAIRQAVNIGSLVERLGHRLGDSGQGEHRDRRSRRVEPLRVEMGSNRARDTCLRRGGARDRTREGAMLRALVLRWYRRQNRQKRPSRPPRRRSRENARGGFRRRPRGAGQLCTARALSAPRTQDDFTRSSLGCDAAPRASVRPRPARANPRRLRERVAVLPHNRRPAAFSAGAIVHRPDPCFDALTDARASLSPRLLLSARPPPLLASSALASAPPFSAADPASLPARPPPCPAPNPPTPTWSS